MNAIASTAVDCASPQLQTSPASNASLRPFRMDRKYQSYQHTGGNQQQGSADRAFREDLQIASERSGPGG
ncbi:hypothetical protein RJJ65_05145 [Rhizobium hidalgonense]|uniref:Uncharacterized protein n=1 Tax=Rhizobium hidalgonense TaxID=1538159 RepID=A0AAJ2LID8_9HYPH|nr:hypothetical protein [Rhizobium hidalgonense]MDR9772052.1 hypothetical protein [Rhizobium hidalgonense]MDR9810110.1 hypothetical protein [Rhizobium hidalgonense]MDR9817862.1 hypothetical protein [Rhizobium hidalgonense]